MKDYFQQQKQALGSEITNSLQEIQKVSKNTHPWAEDGLHKLREFALPGKMIRGILLILAASGKNKDSQHDAVLAGAALEIMHSSILIHDDIMDRDEMRRGSETVHTQYKKMSPLLDDNPDEAAHYGESMASCVGVVGYFAGFNLLSKINNKKIIPDLLRLFSVEMAVLGFGQMEDVDASTHPHHMDENVALRIYDQKTGRYTFGLPLRAGLLLSGKLTPLVEKNIMLLAKSLGVIFQLRDDVLGVFGDSQKTGKSVGGDIRERKQTWLYFELLKCASETDKKKIGQLYFSGMQLSQKDQLYVIDKMKEYSIPELASKKLHADKKKAIKLLSVLPFSPEQFRIITELIEYLVEREK